MIPTDQPSGSSQMLRIDLPSTLMAFLLPGGAHPANHRVCGLPNAGMRPAPTCQRRGHAADLAAQSLRRRPVAAIDYEVEYNNRARVPEHPEIFARWTQEAELYRAEMLKNGRAELGLTYGGTPRQTIDLFLAQGDENAPLAIFIHGGWWRSLEPSIFSQMARGP